MYKISLYKSGFVYKYYIDKSIKKIIWICIKN